MKGIIVCAVGLKGWVFLRELLDRAQQIAVVWTYEDPSDLSHGFQHICALAAAASIRIMSGKRPAFEQGDLVFLVGWQFLVPSTDATLVVMHDSLLPAYRGFSPTVTALIRGETKIGTTAILGTENADEGPILGQRSFQVAYPAKIEAVLSHQASLMAELAVDIVSRWQAGSLSAVPQDEKQATYSLWRDQTDYIIDWTQPADAIARFVDALGFPYEGARTTLENNWITVHEVAVVTDLPFEIRTPGKIWQIKEGKPTVVCGAGLLRIELAQNSDHQPVTFEKVRSRLGHRVTL
jgi:methionyl-tRNA formyltransferase